MFPDNPKCKWPPSEAFALFDNGKGLIWPDNEMCK
jgi:hypothetical protein